MNTQSNAVPEIHLQSQVIEPTAIPLTQCLYWSIRRELWEYRSLYIAPLIAAALFLFGFVINMVAFRRHLSGSPLAGHAGDLLTARYELSGVLIMGTALIVGIFYSIDALYGERRDRSILFWKSLPVSDLTVVLSKFAVPLLILPLLSFVITLATQILMFVLSSTILSGSGVDTAMLWTHVSFLRVSLVLLYHFLTVHGLWYAPIYGWLLLVSAWSPRAPFIWAFLPPFVISGVEKIAFNTSYFRDMLLKRLIGPGNAMASHGASENFMTTLIPVHFFSQPGLWIGLIVATIFLAVTVQLRRYRGPI